MHDFRIHKLLYSEVKEIYPDLFTRIFDRNDKQIPTYVYIGFLGEAYVGFVSAYMHNLDSLYLQYAGFDKVINKHKRFFLFEKVVKFIHREYRNVVFRIENTNTPAIKMAIFTGFKIIGVRFDGVLFVEFIKTREG